MKASVTDVHVLDEENDNGVHITQTEEFASHEFHVINTVDSSVYEASGHTT